MNGLGDRAFYCYLMAFAAVSLMALGGLGWFQAKQLGLDPGAIVAWPSEAYFALLPSIATGLVLLAASLGSVYLIRTWFGRQQLALQQKVTQLQNQQLEISKRFGIATHLGQLGYWDYDIRSGQAFWSSSMSALFGFSGGEMAITRHEWKQLVKPSHRSAFDQLFVTPEHQNEHIQVDLPFRRPSSQHWVFFRTEGLVIFDHEGKPSRIQGICSDLTQRRELKKSLSEAQAQFSSTFEYSGVGMIIYDLKGNITQVNASMCDMLGYSPNELHILSYHSLSHPGDQSDDLRIDEELLQGRKTSIELEKRLIHKNGDVIWVTCSLSTIQDTSGRVLRFIAQVRNITEKKRNEAALLEREHFLRTLSECLPGLVSYWGRDFRCHFANQRHEKWTGIAFEQLRGIHMRQMLSSEVFETDLPRIMAALNGEPQQYERRTKRSNGPQADMLIHLVPDFIHGKVEGFFSLSTDISEVKAQQRKLEQLNDELTQKTEQAISASKSKSAFLANMSHEIRTPMNAIMGLLQLLSSSPLNPQQLDYLGKIESAAEVLLNVLNDVLDISRIEANKLELSLSRFQLRELLEQVVDLFSYRAEEKNIKVRLIMQEDCPIGLVSDRLRLAQILNNLMSNALKFTEAGSITLSIRPIDGHDKIAFSVIDTGIGLSPEQAARLFSPFSQVDDSSSRRFGGAGLGLSICKSLAELLGGHISVESTPQAGSTFTFAITNKEPIYSSDEAPQETAIIRRETAPKGVVNADQVAKQLLEGKRILVVDDHKLNRLVAGEMIKNAGASVIMATNGQEAIDACLQTEFDLVLMDLQMPEVDGFQATEEIRRRMGENAPPIIAITASATEKDRHAILASGMCEHIIKPFKKEALLNCVEAFSGRAKI